MWAALSYRRGQAGALALLAALVTACAVFAPLYDRTMVQSLVDVRLATASPLLSGVQLEASARAVSPWSDEVPPAPPGPQQLLGRVPRWARQSYDAPVLGWTETLQGTVPSVGGLSGQVISRTGACDHVEIVDGRCPAGAGEVLVSTADIEHLGLRVGQRITSREIVADPRVVPPGHGLTITGVYRTKPGDTWFVQDLTGISGSTTQDPPLRKRHDVWLTPEQTFTGASPALTLASSYVGLRLRPSHVGVDEVLRLGSTLSSLRDRTAFASTGPRVRVTTGLTDIADDVRSQQHDSRVIVPLLMAQLALLCLVVLWLALGTITDLRRNEVAVARLRGRGVRGARRLVLGEVLPAMLLGLVPGIAVAWIGDEVAARLLPGSAGPELRLPVVAALVAVALVLVLTAVVAAQRVARVPVDGLLRRSSSVHRGWRVGVLDAVLVTGCAVVVAAFLSGSLDGPAALVAPSIVALLAGLLLAHLLTPAAVTVGRSLLRRGRARAAVGLLEAGRSRTLRSTVTVVTVAAALAVFAIDAVVVSDRNRAVAAEQEAGAPVVALLDGNDLAAVQRAIGEHRGVTPVVRVKAPAADAVTTLAVDPAAFRRIALLPSSLSDAPGWRTLSGGDVTPVAFTGRDLSLVVTDGGLAGTAPDGGPATVTLGADVAEGDHLFHAELGVVPRQGSRRLSTAVSCADGCSLTALTLSTIVGSTIEGSMTVSDLRSGGSTVALGDDWIPYDDPSGGTATPKAAGGALTLQVSTQGQQRTTVSQAWVPQQVPALLTAATPRKDFTLTGLDGRTRAAGVAGTLARVPGAPERAAVVDLDVLRRGTTVATDARVELWAASEAALRPVTQALRADGIKLVDTTRLSDVRSRYDDSTPAWSVTLGLVVGLAAVGVALVLLAVLAISGWRVRVRDLSALWLSGVRRRDVRRLAWTPQLPAVVIGAVVGAACGLLGAVVSMPIVPLFAQAPGVDTLDLATPWTPVLLVTAVLLVVLATWSAGLGWSVFRRVALERLRETA